MVAPHEQVSFERLLDQVVDCLTPGVARQVAELRADIALYARLAELSCKAREGSLTPSELWEYRGCMEAMNVIGALQAKALTRSERR